MIVQNPTQRGFTLIELLVGIAIVALLMGIGVPSYKNIATSSRISSEINALLGDLQLARTEAIKQGQSVTVCTSSDAATCSQSPTWSGGWIVFTDVNANHVVNTAAGDSVLRVQSPFAGTDTMVSDTSNTSWITFNREGFITGLLANPVVLTLRPQPPGTGQWTRCMSIGSIGRLTIQQHTSTPGCV